MGAKNGAIPGRSYWTTHLMRTGAIGPTVPWSATSSSSWISGNKKWLVELGSIEGEWMTCCNLPRWRSFMDDFFNGKSNEIWWFGGTPIPDNPRYIRHVSYLSHRYTSECKITLPKWSCQVVPSGGVITSASQGMVAWKVCEWTATYNLVAKENQKPYLHLFHTAMESHHCQ